MGRRGASWCVVAVLAAAGCGASSHAGVAAAVSPLASTPRATSREPRDTATQLVVVQGTRLSVLDLTTGTVRPLPTDPRLTDHDRLDALAVGGQLVLLGDDNTGAGNGASDVLVTTAGPGSRAQVLGQAGYLVPSGDPGLVWLVDVEDGGPHVGTTLRELDAAGHVHRSAGFPGEVDVRPFGTHFLRSADQGGTALVDDHGTVLHRYAEDVVTAQGDTAVLAERDCSHDCLVRVLQDGAADRTVRVADLPYLPENDLVGTSLVGDVTPESDGPAAGSLVRVDLTTGAVTTPHGTTAPYWGASFATAGDRVFFADGTGDHVSVLDLRTGTVSQLPHRSGTITGLAVL